MLSIRVARTLSLVSALLLLPVAAPASKDPTVPQEIRLIVGFGPGGSFGISSEVVARHLHKHIPGNPKIVVNYRPGAGSLVAANTVYAREPQDGSVIVTITPGLILRQALGAVEGTSFDAAGFQWLGSLRSSDVACFARAGSRVQSVKELMSGVEFPVASLGPMTNSQAPPLLLNHILGTKFRLVEGYRGLAEAVLALEGGEVEGMCISADNAQFLALLDRDPPAVKPILVLGDKAPTHIHSAYKGVPLLSDFPLSDDHRRMLEVLGSPDRMFIPYALGPGVPAKLVEVFRQAFQRMLDDPEFLSDLKKAGQNPVPSTGWEVQRLVERVLKTSPPVLGTLAKILGP